MKALAVNLSNNILLRGQQDGFSITPMKLQKLLYYVCCDYVKETGQMPIDEQFEVWQYGPVLPSVYWEFKSFGPNPIKAFAKDASGRARKVSEDDNPTLARILDIVWAKYKRMSGIALSKQTHMAGSGWLKAFLDGRETISLEDMRNDTSG